MSNGRRIKRQVAKRYEGWRDPWSTRFADWFWRVWDRAWGNP